MNLADKPVYPFVNSDGFVTSRLSQDIDMASFSGITYKEALVLALAGNSGLVDVQIRAEDEELTYVKLLMQTADSIIKELEK